MSFSISLIPLVLRIRGRCFFVRLCRSRGRGGCGRLWWLGFCFRVLLLFLLAEALEGFINHLFSEALPAQKNALLSIRNLFEVLA